MAISHVSAWCYLERVGERGCEIFENGEEKESIMHTFLMLSTVDAEDHYYNMYNTMVSISYVLCCTV
jgi:hypothetical protein